MKKILAFAILIGLLFTACKKNVYFEKYYKFKDNLWNIKDTAVFTFDAPNDTSAYDIYLNIRHPSFYPYKNVWLFIDIIAPNNQVETDTINVILADDKGYWYGEGLGDIWDYKYLYKPNVKFFNGKYKVKIIHGMRDLDDVPIMEMGLIIEKKQNNGQK